MKIYFDGLFYKSSGIGRYYSSLLKGFAERNLEIYTCVPLRFKEEWMLEFNNFKNIIPIFVEYEKFSVKGFFSQSKILKNLEDKVTIFFFPHVNLPFYVPKNTFVTIHDLIPFTNFLGRFKRTLFKFFLNRSVKYSKKIVTISETSEKDIIKYYQVENKIKVIYEFIDEKFFSYKNEKAIINEDYILFVGNRKPHKNLKRLIYAYDKIKEDFNCKLVIAGSKDDERDEVDLIIEELNLKEKIIEFISPNDDVILNLYSNAKLFIFPSLIEGFGLPPLEAIACGCPVITSNIPVLKEILGTEIACLNPESVEDIAEKISFVLSSDDYRKQLYEKGVFVLKKFNKDKIIDEYLDLFNKNI